jgi:hypothetical protein
MSKMYAAMRLCKEAQTNIGQSIRLSWNERQVGALPVFETKTAARKVYGKNVELYEISATESQP